MLVDSIQQGNYVLTTWTDWCIVDEFLYLRSVLLWRIEDDNSGTSQNFRYDIDQDTWQVKYRVSMYTNARDIMLGLVKQMYLLLDDFRM